MTKSARYLKPFLISSTELGLRAIRFYNRNNNEYLYNFKVHVTK